MVRSRDELNVGVEGSQHETVKLKREKLQTERPVGDGTGGWGGRKKFGTVPREKKQ